MALGGRASLERPSPLLSAKRTASSASQCFRTDLLFHARLQAPISHLEGPKSLRARKPGFRGKILLKFQRPKINRECGSSIPLMAASHSLDLRLWSILTRNACILQGFSRMTPVSKDPKIRNFGGNRRKVSSPNRRNSRFGG